VHQHHSSHLLIVILFVYFSLSKIACAFASSLFRPLSLFLSRFAFSLAHSLSHSLTHSDTSAKLAADYTKNNNLNNWNVLKIK